MHRESDQLFLSYAAPFKPVTAKTMARWMVTFLTLAGVDTTKFGQHANRSASVHFLRKERSLSVRQICEIADWSQTSGVFRTFYDRYLCH